VNGPERRSLPRTPSTGSSRPPASRRTPFALAIVLLDLVAMVSLGYLAYVKLANESAVCFVVQGCDRVQTSPYSVFLGIPVAIYGLAVVSVVLAAALAWWRIGDRRFLYVPYALGLLSIFVIAALVYLELFVIHAVCTWCTIADAGIVVGWLASAGALLKTRGEIG
jgi:uncharacterized membrane protein